MMAQQYLYKKERQKLFACHLSIKKPILLANTGSEGVTITSVESVLPPPPLLLLLSTPFLQ
jgi:hypothetical protein